MNTTMLTEQKILEAEKRLLEAMKKSNVEILNELIHDDLTFIVPTGEVITKQWDLETHRSGNIVFEEMTSSIDSIKLIDETAVVASAAKIKGKMLQQSFEGNFRYLRVWKMFDDGIKVIAGSCTSV